VINDQEHDKESRRLSLMREKVKKLLKISELSSRVGVPKEAIRYYVKEGLLPKPKKTSKNMAYYDERFIDRIRAIKELQKKRFLPLRIIKNILGENSSESSLNEIKTLLELDGKIFKPIDHFLDFIPLTAEEMEEKTGLSLAELAELEDMGIIEPSTKNAQKKYDEYEVRIAEAFAKIRSSGVDKSLFLTQDFKIYKDFVEALAQEEVKLLARRITGKMSHQEALRMIDNVFDVVNNFVNLLRKKLIRKTVANYASKLKKEL
jgi:DNA-binding transcriptional MerR regulator